MRRVKPRLNFEEGPRTTGREEVLASCTEINIKPIGSRPSIVGLGLRV